jgi:branched-chain amino acid transport system permease protein
MNPHEAQSPLRPMDTQENGLLTVREVAKEYGGVTALSNVSFQVNHGRIVSLIGPNGAGKTTAINLISGVIRPSAGEVLLGERRISGLDPHEIARLGITRTFQNLQLFRNMSVLENIMVGLHPKTRCGFLKGCLHAFGHRAEEESVMRRACEVLEITELAEHKDRPGDTLPYGLRKRLEMARAWVSRPKLMLLDEPAAGLNGREAEQTAELIIRIRDAGTSVLLVEHNMDLVMDISDHIVVLNYGRKISEGGPHRIWNDPEVIEAYLGGGSRA